MLSNIPLHVIEVTFRIVFMFYITGLTFRLATYTIGLYFLIKLITILLTTFE